MPKKIRELKAMLRQSGWYLVPGGGKGSHTKWRHPKVRRAITLSGGDGDDAQRYQEREVAKGPGGRQDMTAPRYTVIIQWSEEDQCYVVSLPEWGSGCKTHGSTYEEAAKNAREVLELLVGTHDGAKDGPVPIPKLFHYPGADVTDVSDDGAAARHSSVVA